MKEKRPPFRSVLLGTLIAWTFILFILGGILISEQNKSSQAQSEFRDKQIEQQEELIEAIRINGLMRLSANVLNKVDDELKETPEHTLSDATIARIAAISHGFRPTAYVEDDSLSKQIFSLGRGQLLLALCQMEMDSTSFDKIKRTVPFYEADLGGARLSGTDLSHVDLRGANLTDADLSNANLAFANLKGARFWGAKLRQARFTKAKMHRTNLQWADLTEANLNSANLDGAILTSAIFKKAVLQDASLKWADGSESFFNEADLTGAVLYGTMMQKTNLEKANLTGVNFRKMDLTEANLKGATLNEAEVEKQNWLEQLTQWKVAGAAEIKEGYIIFDDTTDKSPYFNLKKKEN